MSRSIRPVVAQPRAVKLAAAARIAACICVLLSGVAHAQDKSPWFVPGTPKADSASAPPRTRRAAPAPAPAPDSLPAADAADPGQAGDGGQDQQAADAIPRYSLPALAPLPALAKTAPPPTAIIGVLGVQDVMRASTAVQLVQKVVGARHDKLQQDYVKEQQVWRDMQQTLVNQRGTLTQEQLQSREKQLQDRVAGEVKEFRARDKIIQEANQISLAQVERVLVAVIRQVAESRGMNLVLHREQVALNISGFDITDQVTAQLNSLLPTVTIPPDGQEPTPANTGGALVVGAAEPDTATAAAGR